MKLAQIMAKLQVTVGKRDRAHGRSASCLARKGIGYLDELEDAVDLRGGDRYDIEAVGEQGIAPSGVVCLLMPLGMESETVVLCRDASLRPE